MSSYLTVAEAQAYFDERLNTDAWDSSIVSDKTKALAQATRIVDRLNFLGVKTEDTQTNQFPRDDDTTVPTDIQYATAEIALALLDGVEPELEFENLQLRSQGYGSVRANYEEGPLPHIVAGVPSAVAWMYLKPYLRDPRTLDIYRIS